ncbi:MAG: sensor domain-containing diguanylate cyclase [Desulfovibrionaceae bacterium]|nr:sensor domain-containing diguanylate cyclase [Desulfovibrionaceae bacterium]
MIALLFSYDVLQNWDYANTQRLRQARTLVLTLASRQQVLINSASTFLYALSFSSLLQDNSKPLTPENIQYLVEKFEKLPSDFLGLFIFSPDGRALCSFINGESYPLPADVAFSRPYFIKTLHNKEFTVNSLFVLDNGQKILPLTLPVYTATGELHAVLMLPLNMEKQEDYLRTAVDSLAFQPHVVGLLDRKKSPLAQYHEHKNFHYNEHIERLLAGALYQDENLLNPLTEKRMAIWSDSTGDYMGFSASLRLQPNEKPYAYMLAIAEKIPLLTFVWNNYLLQFSGFACIVLIMLLLSRYIGLYYFSAGLEKLTDITSQCQQGNLQAIAPVHGCKELTLLGQHYETMLRSLQQSTEQLTRLSYEDALTHIWNRRHFMLKAEQELQRSQRTHSPLCFAMLDIDHFKLVNDTYGHAAGDAVLANFATITRQNLRTSDIFARYGGEEFVICFINSTEQESLAVLERIQQAWQKYCTQYEDKAIYCTISGGCFAVTQKDFISMGTEWEYTLKTILSRADSALYYAKEQGRNTMYAWHPDMMHTQTAAAQQ